MAPTTHKPIVRFGVFDFDLEREELSRSGMRVKLARQPAGLLGLLLAEPGEIVTREAIRARLWPDGTWVDFEQSINQCVRQVRRALRDDAVASRFVETVPRLGYRFVGEVEIVEAGAAGAPAPDPVRQRGLRAVVVLGAVLAIALGLGVASLTRDEPASAADARPFARVQLNKLTHHGAVWTAAISPDGTRLAYVVPQDGGFAVRARSIDGRHDSTIVEPQATPIRAMQFSSAGDELYLVRQETPGPGYSALYRVSSRGGAEPQRVIFDVDTGVSFSPDGSRLAFVRGDPPRESTALVTAGSDGAGEVVVGEWSGPERLIYTAPAWSPDGERIAVVSSRRQAPRIVISTIDVTGGAPLAIGAYPWREVSGLAWLPDGSGLLVAARGPDAEARSQLWRLDYPNGTVRPISNDLSSYAGITFATGGDRFVTMRQERLAPVLTFESPTGVGVLRRDLDFAPRDTVPVVRRGPDGGAIVVARGQERLVVWRVPATGDPEPLLPDTALDVRGIAVSPDGETVVYAIWEQDGIPHLWRTPARGGALDQITDGAGEFAAAACPAGVVVYRRQDAGGLWRSTGLDEPPQRITDLEPTTSPLCSPDGTRIAFPSDVTRDPLHERRLLVVPADGNGPVLSMPWSDGSHLAWSPAGDALTYAGRPDVPNVVWRLALGATEPERLFESPLGGIMSFDWSADGSTLLAIHGSMQSDVVLVADVR